ncbi:hypothetical protein C7389_12855, partial [Azoarcus indigens]
RGMRGLSGSSILGSGEVALILDVAAMSHIATSQENHTTPPASDRVETNTATKAL